MGVTRAQAELPPSLWFPPSHFLIPPWANGTVCGGGFSYSILQSLLRVPHFWINIFEKAFLSSFLQDPIGKSPFHAFGTGGMLYSSQQTAEARQNSWANTV